MDSSLQQTLRNLCSNTEWKYAVFWKLEHRARMILTLEDAYYDNRDQNNPPEYKCFSKTPTNLNGGRYSHDPLGLTVAKMSYHIYSLGEGIVGQVVVSGKHQWIFAEHANSSGSFFELYDGWQSQFSAGIKTILFIAVGPRGVVQLGSLNKVNEDVLMVTRIRDLFSDLKNSSEGHATNSMQFSMTSPACLPDLPPNGSGAETFPNFLGDVDKVLDREGSNFGLPPFIYTIKKSDDSQQCTSPLPYIYLKKDFGGANKHGGLQSFSSENCEGAKFRSADKVSDLKDQNQMGMDFINYALFEGETIHSRCLSGELDRKFHTDSSYNVLNIASSYGSCSYLDSAAYEDLKIDGIGSYESEVLQVFESSDDKYLKDMEKKLESQINQNNFDGLNTSVSFFSGSELLEALGLSFLKRNNFTGEEAEQIEGGALGPSFLKRNNFTGEEAEQNEGGATIQLTEDMSNNQLTFDPGPENLLEAVVTNLYHSCSGIRNEISSSRSMHSLLTTNKMNESSSSHEMRITINPVGCSINQPSPTEGNTSQNSSEICGAFSSIGFSSTCPSGSSEQFQKSIEISKKNKRRARPGENSRPRPRDRQLIQDRIKELRELVPNGSKCSIDSLLERTMKHMLFLQGVTKHADKLSKCTESKETGMLGSSNSEQGSSWAVEVGGHLKVCSIVVENLNKQGLMLIEMLCEECSHFLEIAEAIRSLGIRILKGVTEAHGEKTWICFVVEGQNKKVMHRMDILCSLLQIFQPKATVKQ